MLVEKNITEEPRTMKEVYISGRAFTLVELMVVVAVIGMLLMILLPNLRRARERARSTACQNNLRQYGIAMGRYLSDWKGYFIYPGEGGSAGKTYKPGVINIDDFEDKVLERGGIAGSVGQGWSSFISGYLPLIQSGTIVETNASGVVTSAVNLACLLGGVSSVRMCPSVQQELINGNYFDPAAEKYFKGYRTEDVGGEHRDDIIDFEPSGSTCDAAGNFYLAAHFTTYAINLYSDVYQKDRKNISDRTIAFIDWNAKEGWDATLYNATNVWQFSTLPGRSPSHSQGTPKCPTSSSNIWWLTEVGFHHKEGTNAYANYVAMDGSVSSVASNQISQSYFESTGPR